MPEYATFTRIFTDSGFDLPPDSTAKVLMGRLCKHGNETLHLFGVLDVPLRTTITVLDCEELIKVVMKEAIVVDLTSGPEAFQLQDEVD